MASHLRPLARLGAALLVASAGLAVAAVPAHAEDAVVDVAVDVVGTRVAADATGKVAWVKISNHGTVTPDLIAVNVSARDFDYSKVRVEPAIEGCDVDGDEKNDRWDCPLRGDQIPGPGETVEVPLVVLRTTDKLTEPYRATLRVSVSPWDNHEPLTDANPADNADDYPVELTTENGVDLSVVAPDVKREIAFDDVLDDNPKTGPLNPGDKTVVFAYIVNQGDRIAEGLDLTISLPKGVVFDDGIQLKECEYSADRRSADCRAGLLQLAPGNGVTGAFPVVLDMRSDKPVTIPGGTVTVSARGELPATDSNLARPSTTLPSFLLTSTGASAPTAREIDQSDNSDDFAFVVTPTTAGGGGGGGGDQDGGLPVTGVQAGLIGGIGGAVLLAGAVLMILARRRKVVVVAPGDEKSED